jgi:hypothetical protein
MLQWDTGYNSVSIGITTDGAWICSMFASMPIFVMEHT